MRKMKRERKEKARNSEAGRKKKIKRNKTMEGEKGGREAFVGSGERTHKKE